MMIRKAVDILRYGDTCRKVAKRDRRDGVDSAAKIAANARSRSTREPLWVRACAEPKWLETACAVTRRRFPVGARPTRRFAPAGSNRSSHGGNEMAEAFD
jgi:hypothetical protein